MTSAKQVAEVMNVHFQPDDKSPLEFRKTIWLKDVCHKGRKKNCFKGTKSNYCFLPVAPHRLADQFGFCSEQCCIGLEAKKMELCPNKVMTGGGFPLLTVFNETETRDAAKVASRTRSQAAGAGRSEGARRGRRSRPRRSAPSASIHSLAPTRQTNRARSASGGTGARKRRGRTLSPSLSDSTTTGGPEGTASFCRRSRSGPGGRCKQRCPSRSSKRPSRKLRRTLIRFRTPRAVAQH